MFLLGSCFLLVGLFMLGLTFNLYRQIQKNAIAPTNAVGLVCPYCQISITGARQLDVINHVGCITKSELDMATMKKELEVAPKDEYYHRVMKISGKWATVCNHRSGEQYWKYNSSTSKYDTFEGRLYRNGEEISCVWGTTKDNAVLSLKAEQALDEHKRRTKSKRK